jgi:hypothetical protein
VHQIGLYKLDEAFRQLTDWLPKGPQTDPDPSVNADSELASAERSALITLTHYVLTRGVKAGSGIWRRGFLFG